MAGNKNFAKELSRLISLKATEDDVSQLLSMGINVKNPTKMTLLAAALYEKAAKGDLSALKEVITRVDPQQAAKGGVIFIDDIGDKA